MARRGYLERPAVVEKLVTLIAIEGYSDQRAAGAVSTRRERVQRQAVTAWRKRHQAELEAARQQQAEHMEAAIEDSLRGKEGRIRERIRMVQQNNELVLMIRELIQQRGSLETEEPKWVGPAETGREYGMRRFDASLIREIERLQRNTGSLLDSIAAELGDIPRPPTLHHAEPPPQDMPYTVVLQQILNEFRIVGQEYQYQLQQGEEGAG